MSANVLHFRSDFLGVTETFIARAIRALEQGGRFTPFVLCRRRVAPHPLGPDRILALNETAQGAELPGRGRGSTLGGRIAQRFAPGPGAVSLSAQAEDWLRGVRPALIHAHFGYDGWAALPVAEALGIPLVVSFYGHDLAVHPRRWIWRRRYRRLFARADRCLAEGAQMLQTLRDLGCPAQKLRLLRNPLPERLPAFRARAWKDATVEPVRLLLVARLVEKKGHVHALRALAALRPEFPKLQLELVGDGPLRAEIEAEVARLALGGVVSLRGMLPAASLPERLEAADALLVPSVHARNGDHEGGAPNVLLDAQAAGLPVVATRHRDIPDFVVPGESALLAAEGDASALADCLRQLLSKEAPRSWEEMGRSGRDHVERTFHADRVLAQLHAIYEALRVDAQARPAR